MGEGHNEWLKWICHWAGEGEKPKGPHQGLNRMRRTLHPNPMRKPLDPNCMCRTLGPNPMPRPLDPA